MSFAHPLLHYLLEHLQEVAFAVGGFFFGIFVKKPLESWWESRGKLAQTRKNMYLALADIYTEVQSYQRALKRILSPDGGYEVASAITVCIESFNQQIYAGKYDVQLKAVQAIKESMLDEAQGFERVTGLVGELSKGEPEIAHQVDSLNSFCLKFLQAIIIEQFDQKKLLQATVKWNELKTPRAARKAAIAVDESLQHIKKAQAQSQAELSALYKQLDEIQNVVDKQTAEKQTPPPD